MSAIDDLVEIEAIKRVRSLYCHHFDSNDIDRLADLFTEDAVCEFGKLFGGDWVGREQIRRRFRRRLGHGCCLEAGKLNGHVELKIASCQAMTRLRSQN